jgi:hypothetical protein
VQPICFREGACDASLETSPIAGRTHSFPTVVELHHYQEKTITQAAKELRIGRPRASRLHARALVTLRAAVENPTFYPYRREEHEPERSRRADPDAVRPSS